MADVQETTQQTPRPSPKTRAKRIAEGHAQASIDAANARAEEPRAEPARTDAKGGDPVVTDKTPERTRRRRRRDGPLDGFYQMREVVTVDRDPAYEYRWVSEKPGRVQHMQDNDWDVVVEQDPVHKGRDENGQSRKGYLMRKRKDWYEDDQAKKRRFNQSKMKAIKAGQGTGDPNENAPRTTDGRPGLYTPAGAVSIREGVGSRDD